MHEELWNDGEDIGETSHPKIMRATRAPIDGVIGNRAVQTGDYVQTGQRLASVVPLPAKKSNTSPSGREDASSMRRRMPSGFCVG